MQPRRLQIPSADSANVSIRSPEHPLRGRYRLQFLSRGGMGTAYRAQVGQRACFVKEVSADAAEFAEHLRREAKILQRLPLGNFPRFVEAFEEDGYLYLVTEFLEGVTLEQEVLRNAWTFPEEDEIRELADGLCHQLEILHALKPPLLYLDLKPANVIRTSRGQIYLVDFGISQVFTPPYCKGNFQGSPQTASPEHFTGKLDLRSDLFCLAATVHYVATRGQAEREPFGPFLPVGEIHPEISEGMERWLARCLRLNPEERFGSVAEARMALLKA